MARPECKGAVARVYELGCGDITTVGDDDIFFLKSNNGDWISKGEFVQSFENWD